MPLCTTTFRRLFITLACVVAGSTAPASPREHGQPGALAWRTAPFSTIATEDLWWPTIHPTHAGWVHPGCQSFADAEDVIGRGPISKVAVYHGGLIHAIRLWYGRDGAGEIHGFSEGISVTEWPVPDGERITRIEGQISGHYVSRLQFFTDEGHASPQFGGQRGRSFVVTDPANGALRTISGSANLRRHPSLNRAIAAMTFHFGAPYFIKDIKYDLAALESARRNTAPEQCASQDFTNGTSLEQASTYTNTLSVAKTTTLTFEQAVGLTFGSKLSFGYSGGLLPSFSGGAEVSFEETVSSKSGQSYSSAKEERVSWSVPVRVPPGTRVVATSTWRKYKARIPFTYTVAWYEGTKDNIKKEVKLPGVYEDVRVDDLKHEFKEARLK